MARPLRIEFEGATYHLRKNYTWNILVE